jgi:hypothetical protein
MKCLIFPALCLLFATSVLGQTPPVNDSISGALTLPVSPFGACQYQKVSTIGATPDEFSDGLCAPQPKDVWYRVVVPTDGRYVLRVDSIVKTSEIFLNVVVQLYRSAPNLIPMLDPCKGVTEGYPSVVLPSLKAGETYYLRTWAHANGEGVWRMCIESQPTPANDQCNAAAPFAISTQGSCSFTRVSNVGASQSLGCANNDVWFSITPVVTGRHRIRVDSFKALAAYSDAVVFQILESNCFTATMSSCQQINGEALTPILTAGKTYYLCLWSNYKNSYAQWRVCLEGIPIPVNDECPEAISLPVSASGNCTYTTITNVSATAKPRLSCQTAQNNIRDVWFTVTPKQSGNHLLKIEPFNKPAFSSTYQYELYKGSCDAVKPLSCTGIHYGNTVTPFMEAGLTYYLRFWMPEDRLVFWNVCLESPLPTPPNDVCGNAQPFIIAPRFDTCVYNKISTVGATAGVDSNCYIGNDVWLTFTASIYGKYKCTFANIKPLFKYPVDISFELYKGTCGALIPVECNFSPLHDSLLTLEAGVAYYMRINIGRNSNYGSLDMCIRPPAAADNCSDATTFPISPHGVRTFYPVVFENAAPSTLAACDKQAADIWFVIKPASSGPHTIRFDTFKCANIPFFFDLYEGSCQALTPMWSCGKGTISNYSLQLPPLNAGAVYYIRFSTYAPGIRCSWRMNIESPPVQPVKGDLCADAIALPVSPLGGCLFSTVSNEWSNPTPGNACPNQSDVWLQFTPPISGKYLIRADSILRKLGDTYGLVMELYSGTCDQLTPLTANCYVFSLSWLVTPPLSANKVYYLRLWTNNEGSAAQWKMCASPLLPPANDECAGARALFFSSVDFSANATFSTAGATGQSPVAQCSTPNDAEDDVWFTFKAPSTGAHRLSFGQIPGALSQTFGFQLFKGSCNKLQSLICNWRYLSSDPPFSWYAIKDSVYYVKVWSNGKNQAAEASIRVTAPKFVQNDDCAGAVPLPLLPPDSCAFLPVSTFLATPSAPPSCNVNSDDDVWFALKPSTQGRYLIKIDQYKPLPGYEGSIVMFAVYSGGCGGSLKQTGFCQYITENPYTPVLSPGTTYYLRLWTTEIGNRATWNMCVSLENKKALCSSAMALPVSPKGACAFSPLPMKAGPAIICGGLAPYDQWITFTPDTSGDHIFRCKNFNVPVQEVWFYELYRDTCGEPANEILCKRFYLDAIVLPLKKGVTYFLHIGLNKKTPPSWSVCLEAPFPTPANDDCATAITLPLASDITCVFSPLATHSARPAPIAGSCATGVVNDVWYRFTPAATGSHTFAVRNLVYAASPARIGYQILKGTCAGFSEILCDSALVDGDETPVLTGGTTYYLRLWNVEGYSAAWEMCLESTALAAKNDLCQNAAPIADGSNVGQSLAGATPDLSAPVCEGVASADKGVWFVYTPGLAEKSPLKIDACNNQYDLRVRVYTGTCDALVCYEGDNDDDCPGGFGAESTVFTPFAFRGGVEAPELAQKYYILISGAGSALRFSARTGTSAAPEAPADPFESLAIAPNPSTGMVAIQWRSPRVGQPVVRFFNALGQIVLQQPVSAREGDNVFFFDLSDWPPNLYRVQLIYDAWCSRPAAVQKI